ncbi:pancreatic secretory granule membrane major glycoprotein GP2-like [Colossoma macropomum]|uniref:pancreatic secretory granule membrane major glycoprotein GP2-like n=1 Tax=Colossoma macropomum TaxID=42526 RepID=UPI001863C33E|nr:pancreatic secretory granule membrane major glycoprotein GP2-like [Colossoma macropomum]
MWFLIPLCVALLSLLNGGLIKGQQTGFTTTFPQSATGQTTAEVTGSRPSYDPCNNYTSLDQPWRANNETGSGICDRNFIWNGWYRLFFYGMNIRMAESCVPTSRCGSYYTLWLNGPHPQIEDGVVTRQVCGNQGSDCCYFTSTQIRVKACPDNYYIYEFVRPIYCNMAYCTSNVFMLSLTSCFY